MHPRTTHRGLTAMALAALLALVGGNLASADIELGDHGHFGPHMLDDASFSPGVSCVYAAHPNAYRLARVRVKAPYVHPVGADPQKVGWDFRLQQAPSPSGPWKTVATSSRVTAIATASSTADLKSLSIARSFAGSARYRVIMGIYWYKHGTHRTINGWSRHRLEYYKLGGSLPKPQGIATDECAGSILRL